MWSLLRPVLVLLNRPGAQPWHRAQGLGDAARSPQAAAAFAQFVLRLELEART